MAWMAAATVAGWLVTDSEQPLPSTPPQINSPRETFSQVFMAVNLSHFHHIYSHMGSVGGLLSGQGLDGSHSVPIQTGNRDLGMEMAENCPSRGSTLFDGNPCASAGRH